MDSNLLLGVAAELLQNVLGDYAEAHRRPLQNCTPLEGTRQRWASAPTVATAAAVAAMAAAPAAAAAIAAAAPQAHSTGAAPAWRSWPACLRTFCAGRPPRHQTPPPPRHLCLPCAGGPPCQHRSRLQAAGQQGWQCVKHTSAAAEVLACPASKDAAQFLPLQPAPVGTAQRGLTSDGEQLLVRAVLDHLATAHNCTRGWHIRRMAHTGSEVHSAARGAIEACGACSYGNPAGHQAAP